MVGIMVTLHGQATARSIKKYSLNKEAQTQHTSMRDGVEGTDRR